MPSLRRIELLVQKGFHEDALEEAESIEDRLEKIKALGIVVESFFEKGLDEDALKIIEKIIKISKKLRDPVERATALAMLYSLLFKFGYVDDAVPFLDEAFSVAEKIGDPLRTAQAIANIAYYLALAGEGLRAREAFDLAFDLIINSGRSYHEKTDSLITLAELIERAADNVSSPEAIPLYHMALDIFDRLRIAGKPGIIEKKIRLAETVYVSGLPHIRRLLEEGKFGQALAEVERLGGEESKIGKLEIVLWMKTLNIPNLEEFIESIRHLKGFSKYTERAAIIFTYLGLLDEALEIAESLNDNVKDKIMKEIAIEYARRGETEKAYEVMYRIVDPAIRTEVMEEIEGTELT